MRLPEPCLYPRGLARSPRSCRVRCCTTCTGVGEANWTDHNKDRLRFPYDFIFSRSHYLHPHPYVCISCVIHPLTAWVTADAIMRGGACCAVEQLALERAQASASVGRVPGPDLMIRTEHDCNIIEAPWLVHCGHCASLRHHNPEPSMKWIETQGNLSH